MTLKTDYKDYTFQEGETLRKYQQISNDDGTISFRDVTSYQQEGDRFSASDINSTNAKVNELNQTVGGIQTDVSGLQTDVSALQTKSFEGESGTIETQSGYIHDMMIFGKSVQDGTPTPDNPIEIQSVVNPKVTVCGKNLIPICKTISVIENGIAWTNNRDGTITLNGTATEKINSPDIIPSREGSILLSVGQTYKLTGVPNVSGVSINLQSTNYKHIATNTSSIEPHFTAQYTRYYSWIAIEKGTTLNNVIIKPMVTADLNATYNDFEPYKGQSATLPYTLNAIPVTEGGNVTIDGQQYISDYVDIENKKLVRNVGEVDMGTLSWVLSTNFNGCFKTDLPNYKQNIGSVICEKYISVSKSSEFTDKTVYAKNNTNSTFIKDSSYTDADSFKQSVSGSKLLYELATPTETDLTDEEVAQFKALKAYEPTTNIIASSDVLNPLVKCDYSLNKETNNIYDRLQENASDVSNITNRLNGLTFVALTQTEYDALATKDNNTIYFITEG